MQETLSIQNATGRAQCQVCRQKIDKNDVEIIQHGVYGAETPAHFHILHWLSVNQESLRAIFIFYRRGKT